MRNLEMCRSLGSRDARYLSVDIAVVRDVLRRCHAIDGDFQTIVGDDEDAAEAISKVVVALDSLVLPFRKAYV